jgi:hypothetical protein
LGFNSLLRQWQADNNFGFSEAAEGVLGDRSKPLRDVDFQTHPVEFSTVLILV